MSHKLRITENTPSFMRAQLILEDGTVSLIGEALSVTTLNGNWTKVKLTAINDETGEKREASVTDDSTSARVDMMFSTPGKYILKATQDNFRADAESTRIFVGDL